MSEPIQSVTIAEIIPTRVWIEDDFCGSRHVMVQHQWPGQVPFCYCSFHYNYAYTDNASTWRSAEDVARSLGATDPIERRHRGLMDESAQRFAAQKGQ